MKRFLIILLIPVFLLATGGLTVHYLYCKGKLSQRGFSMKTCCKDVKKGGCCEKESKLIKVKDQFVKLSNAFDLVKNYIVFTHSFHLPVSTEYQISFLKITWDKAPPILNISRVILFHSLII